MAHVGFCLLLRDGSSFLNLHNGTSGLLLHEQGGGSIGSSISGGTFSRGRWRKMVEEVEEARQKVIEQRDRERNSRIEAKRKARIEAEAARKAKVKADQAALKVQVESLVGNSRADAARAAHAIMGTLEDLRIRTLAANSARQRAETEKALAPKPKPDSLEQIRDLMKRIRVEDISKRDVIRDIMKLDLVSEIMKSDLVGGIMKNNKDKYGLK